jgi:hypothetical protein
MILFIKRVLFKEEAEDKNWISKLINIGYRDGEIKKQVNDEKMHFN